MADLAVPLEPPRRLSRSALRWMSGLAALFIALKLLHLVTANVFMDEAYYWLWGQHPALSYYDHPPLNAWLQDIAGTILGWNKLALRAMLVLSTIGDIAVLYLFAQRLAGTDWEAAFWPTLLLFAATPITFTVTALAIPDHWLTFFCLLSLYGFYSFLQSSEAGAPRWGWLYLGATALGLATLCKYNAALLGVGVGLYIMLTPRFRRLLRSPLLWLAVLLALAIQAPVVIWNAQEGFSSFQFILQGRHKGLAQPNSLSGVLGFFLGALAFLGPFFVVALWRLLAARDAGTPVGLARTIFLTSSVVILLASVFTDVLFHWNLVAYLGVLPFLYRWFRPLWLWIGHLLYAALFAGIVLCNYSVIPIMALISYADETSAWSYGWPEIGAAVRNAQRDTGATVLAGTDYTIASTLAFELRDKDVTSVSDRRDAFDYWATPDRRGQDFIVVAEKFRPFTDEMRKAFKAVKRLQTIEISRFGKPIDTYRLFLAQDYQP